MKQKQVLSRAPRYAHTSHGMIPFHTWLQSVCYGNQPSNYLCSRKHEDTTSTCCVAIVTRLSKIVSEFLISCESGKANVTRNVTTHVARRRLSSNLAPIFTNDERMCGSQM
ncbi:hypothetical protein OUZ56_013797 [Daphnia magna]|uniref:Uncharacterized protein n=1 Tax=Daphnia magna TaxID=35525 RepID=A0ABQ9Z7N5_9CRUS|nr:hypothetical protein OUZ56_013797 [Daphnia magna]